MMEGYEGSIERDKVGSIGESEENLEKMIYRKWAEIEVWEVGEERRNEDSGCMEIIGEWWMES